LIVSAFDADFIKLSGDGSAEAVAQSPLPQGATEGQEGQQTDLHRTHGEV